MALSLFPRFGSFFDEFDHYGMSVGPAVHVRESETALILEFEVPRYRAEDLRVEVRGDTLVVSGRRPEERPHHDYAYNQFLFGETPSNSFRRAFQIPRGFDPTKVAHELSFGVLTVTIARRPTPPPLPEPVKVPIAGAPASTAVAAPQTSTDSRGLTVTSTASPAEYNAVAQMKWPPKVKVDDSENAIRYTCSMPPSVTGDHIDLSLRGRTLNLAVNHQRKVQKKDKDGNVVFNEEQSVSYSTPLLVPEGTVASDISTEYKDGNLTITVSKHANPTQKVPVAQGSAAAEQKK
jgi:HSP20 family molecular chaperone IbpA